MKARFAVWAEEEELVGTRDRDRDPTLSQKKPEGNETKPFFLFLSWNGRFHIATFWGGSIAVAVFVAIDHWLLFETGYEREHLCYKHLWKRRLLF